MTNYISFLKGKKYYLNVPYKMKDEVKAFGCRFDFEKTQWYIYNNNPKFEEFIDKYTNKIFVDEDGEIADYYSYMKRHQNKNNNDNDLEELEKEFQKIINK